MSEELIKAVQDLINSDKGDNGRLEHILETLKKGKSLFSSDQKYLENLLEHKNSEESKIEEKITANETRFCSKCGNQIQSDHNFCTKCGMETKLLESTIEPTSKEDSDKKQEIKPRIKRSPMWYLLPIYFSIIGGLISYFVIKKYDSKKARNCLIIGVSLFVIPSIIMFGLYAAFGLQNPFYIVSSDHMYPNLTVFDVLMVQSNDHFDEIQVGDIIVFDRPSGHDRVIVSRVAEILDENSRVIRTKGDANPASMPGTDFPVTENEYIGKVTYVIPQVGYIVRIFTPPLSYVIIPIVVILPIIIVVIAHIEYRKRAEV
jgi:signal peptidase I